MMRAARISELAQSRPVEALVAGIALVDVLSQVKAEVPSALDLEKGGMNLIGREEARRISAAMGESEEVSGGGAANTALGLARLGARTAFAGKVADDRFGAVFTRDLREGGVRFETEPLPRGAGIGTGRSLILITPDSDRTMCTLLGASERLGQADMAREPIEDAAMVFAESFLFDIPRCAEAVRSAFARARKAGTAVAFNLSDPECVKRNMGAIREEIALGVDVLVANESEVRALAGTGDLELSLQHIRDRIPVAAVTRSERGAIVLRGNETFEIEAEPVARVLDTTGAGDSFAAGFLLGVLHGFPPVNAARLGAKIAAIVIQELGARPKSDLASLLESGEVA